MNKDLIIGLVSSLAIHFLVLNPFLSKSPPPKRAAVQKDEVIQMEMPPLDEEKEDIVKDLDDTPVENQLAPSQLGGSSLGCSHQCFYADPYSSAPSRSDPASKGAINIPVMKPGANFGKGMELFDVSQLDQKPGAARSRTANLSVRNEPGGHKWQRHRSEFIISTNGDVTQAQVVRSSPREFEVPAIQAVLKWKFKPGRRGGRAVNVRASQLIEFNLDDNK